MNFRLILCVLAGMATTLGSLIMLLGHFRRPAALPPPPKPNFRVVSEEAVDEATGEKLVYREITVSTKLAGQGGKGEAGVAPVEEPVKAAGPAVGAQGATGAAAVPAAAVTIKGVAP